MSTGPTATPPSPPPGRAVPDRAVPRPVTESEPVDPEWARLAHLLHSLVVAAYGQGWQPAELLRHARRAVAPSAQQLARLVIAADHESRSADAYHPRWLEHIAGLDLPVDEAIPAAPSGVLRGPTEGHGVDDARSLVHAWSGLPELPSLLPPPSGIHCRLSVDLVDSVGADPILDKVRALLAKAEATTYEPEAEAFTAKAHELMARHLIDDALVASSRRRSGQTNAHPITIRLPIDAPYATPKSILIAVVADAGGCRAVHHQALGLTSVVGHAPDVAAVELLFTSLLVQAQRAMHAEAHRGQSHRSRGFRSSFLSAFAYRVGERLRDVNDDVRRSMEASTGRHLVPVLAEREAEVSVLFDRIFPRVVARRGRRQWDPRGAVSGRHAADRAQLDTSAVRAARIDPALPGTR